MFQDILCICQSWQTILFYFYHSSWRFSCMIMVLLSLATTKLYRFAPITYEETAQGTQSQQIGELTTLIMTAILFSQKCFPF